MDSSGTFLNPTVFLNLCGYATTIVTTWIVSKAKAEGHKDDSSASTDTSLAKISSAEVSELRASVAKYERTKSKLESASQIHEYEQPVVLVGPRGVGKTSLALQWAAPWSDVITESTRTHKVCKVPIYDFRKPDKVPSFWDPEVSVWDDVHLVLKIHDFPGELQYQQAVAELVKKETISIRNSTGRAHLGIVLICMFDASEACTGPCDETTEYYNGELFRQLRTLTANGDITLDRLILVFNKFDRLRELYKGTPKNDSQLLEWCVKTLRPVFSPLTGICNKAKICEIPSVLEREGSRKSNRGDGIIKGESSRAFVGAIAGDEAAQKMTVAGATYTAAGMIGAS